MKFTSDNLDYDRGNMRRHEEAKRLFFEAWIEGNETAIVVDVVEFLEYCRQTGHIHEDAFIMDCHDGYISTPVEGTVYYDYQKEDFVQVAEKPIQCSIKEFLSDFSGNGLTEALVNFLNDCEATKPIEQ